MTAIVLDEKAGAMPLRQLFEQPPDHEIEFWNADGEFIGTLTMRPREGTPEQYARLIVEAEKDIDLLRHRAATPVEQCVSATELLSRINSPQCE